MGGAEERWEAEAPGPASAGASSVPPGFLAWRGPLGVDAGKAFAPRAAPELGLGARGARRRESGPAALCPGEAPGRAARERRLPPSGFLLPSEPALAGVWGARVRGSGPASLRALRAAAPVRAAPLDPAPCFPVVGEAPVGCLKMPGAFMNRRLKN